MDPQDGKSSLVCAKCALAADALPIRLSPGIFCMPSKTSLEEEKPFTSRLDSFELICSSMMHAMKQHNTWEEGLPEEPTELLSMCFPKQKASLFPQNWPHPLNTRQSEAVTVSLFSPYFHPLCSAPNITMVAYSYHSKFAKDFTIKTFKMNRFFNENVKQKISNT